MKRGLYSKVLTMYLIPKCAGEFISLKICEKNGIRYMSACTVCTNLHGLCWQKTFQGSSGTPFLKGPDNAIATGCNIAAIGDQKGISICAGDFRAKNLDQSHRGDTKSRVGIHTHDKTRQRHSAHNNLSTIIQACCYSWRDRRLHCTAYLSEKQ